MSREHVRGRTLMEPGGKGIPAELDMESTRTSAFIDSPDVFPSIESENQIAGTSWLLWNNRGRIFRVAAIAGVAVLIIALFRSNTYRSTTQLMPPEQKAASGLAAMASMAGRVSNDNSMLGADLLNLGMQSTGDLFVGILQSRTAQEGVVQKFDLTKIYGVPWLHLKVQNEDARKRLEQSTEIDQDRKSGIITISVSDQDPQRAAGLAKAYVDELDILIAALSTSAAGRERRFLEQRLKEVKRDLDDAVHQLGEFSSTNTTFDPKDQGEAMVNAAAALQGELIAAESQLRGLEAIYTSNNVRVRSLRERIKELRRQIGKLSGVPATSADTTPGSDDSMPFPSLRQLPLLGTKYADLYRRAKIQETVYQILTQQYEMAKVQEAKEIPTVRVLDVANVPERKWGPHRGLLALMGAIVGLLCACVWVIGENEWNKRPLDDPYKSLLTEVAHSVEHSRAGRFTKSVAFRMADRFRKSKTNSGSGSASL